MDRHSLPWGDRTEILGFYKYESPLLDWREDDPESGYGGCFCLIQISRSKTKVHEIELPFWCLLSADTVP